MYLFKLFCARDDIVTNRNHYNPFWWQYLPRLRILNLSHSHGLTKCPDFEALPNLERLILKDCINLIKVHDSIMGLRRLRLLNLKGCIKLRKLPGKIRRLESLEKLDLSGCSNLNEPEKLTYGSLAARTRLVLFLLVLCYLIDWYIHKLHQLTAIENTWLSKRRRIQLSINLSSLPLSAVTWKKQSSVREYRGFDLCFVLFCCLLRSPF